MTIIGVHGLVKRYGDHTAVWRCFGHSPPYRQVVQHDWSLRAISGFIPMNAGV